MFITFHEVAMHDVRKLLIYKQNKNHNLLFSLVLGGNKTHPCTW